MDDSQDSGAGRVPHARRGTVQERVLGALDECRPHLRADGGDIELVRITPDGIAELRFTGECSGCSLSKMTLRAGIERVVMRHAPEIRRVETVQ